MNKTKRVYKRIRTRETKSCTVCGNNYTAIRRDSMYCSSSCAVTAYNDRLRKNKPEDWLKKLEDNAEKAKARRNRIKALEQEKQEKVRLQEEKRRHEALMRQKEQKERERKEFFDELYSQELFHTWKIGFIEIISDGLKVMKNLPEEKIDEKTEQYMKWSEIILQDNPDMAYYFRQEYSEAVKAKTTKSTGRGFSPETETKIMDFINFGVPNSHHLPKQES